MLEDFPNSVLVDPEGIIFASRVLHFKMPKTSNIVLGYFVSPLLS
jgi:hypothetical protein